MLLLIVYYTAKQSLSHPSKIKVNIQSMFLEQNRDNLKKKEK